MTRQGPYSGCRPETRNPSISLETIDIEPHLDNIWEHPEVLRLTAWGYQQWQASIRCHFRKRNVHANPPIMWLVDGSHFLAEGDKGN